MKRPVLPSPPLVLPFGHASKPGTSVEKGAVRSPRCCLEVHDDSTVRFVCRLILLFHFCLFSRRVHFAPPFSYHSFLDSGFCLILTRSNDDNPNSNCSG